MHLRRRLAAALVTMLAAAPLPAGAATITYRPGPEDNIADLVIKGPIETGDKARFISLVGAMRENTAIVYLTSPGGAVVEGLNIGLAIRALGFATAAIGQCASTCGLMWLAGSQRFANHDSAIGFHAAYTQSGADAHESGRANALVGAYVARLGLTFGAVAYVTTAGPDGMTWLSSIDAERVGIDYHYISATSALAPATVAPIAPAASPGAALALSSARTAALNTSAYNQGRQARLGFERWFTGLAPGGYLDGATFWAANRGLKPQPTCTNPAQPAWQEGCVDSRARLTTVDQRRKAEANFWLGWNSL